MAIFKKIAVISLRISISIILLTFLFRQVDTNSLLAILKKANKTLLFFGFFIYFFVYLFCFLRWKMLLNALGIRSGPKRLISAFAAGVFFNSFLPSSIGGDFMRSIDLAMHTKKTNEVLASVILDRLSGLIGLVAIASIALFFAFRLIQNKIIFLSVFLIAFILTLILLISFNKSFFLFTNKLLDFKKRGRIITSLSNIHKEIFYFSRHKKIALNNIFLSLLIQFISPLISYIIARAVGINLNIIYFFIVSPIIGAITLLPISIGGLGLRDASSIFFYAKLGIAKDLSFAMSLLNTFFLLVYAAIGGVIHGFSVISHQSSANSFQSSAFDLQPKTKDQRLKK